MLNSFEEFSITRVAAVNSFVRVLDPWEGKVYIVIHRQTVSLYNQVNEDSEYPKNECSIHSYYKIYLKNNIYFFV